MRAYIVDRRLFLGEYVSVQRIKKGDKRTCGPPKYAVLSTDESAPSISAFSSWIRVQSALAFIVVVVTPAVTRKKKNGQDGGQGDGCSR